MHAEANMFPRWLLAAITAACVVLLGGGAWYYQVEQAAGRQLAEKQLAAIAHLKVNQIVVWRSERLGDAAVITDSPFLARGVGRFLADPNGAHTEELRSYFRSLQKHYQYSDILLVSPEGQVLLSQQSSAHGNGYAAALAEALRERKPVFTDLHNDALHSSPHISVVAPIFAGAGQAAAPLGAIVLLSDATQFLYPLIQSWPTPSVTAETLIVRRDGDAVLFLNDLRHQRDAALKLRIPLSRTNVPAVMAVQGKKGLVEGLDYRGVAVVAVVLPVPDSSWFIVAKDNTAEVFAGWHSRAALVLSLLAGLAVSLAAVGLFLWQRRQKAHYRSLYTVEAKLRASTERHSITLQAVGDGIIATDAQGLVELLNPVAEALTGWRQEDASGRPLAEVFHIVNEATRKEAQNPVAKVLREGTVVGMANHTLLIAKDGVERPIADSAAPIRDDQGEIVGVVLVFRDQSEERRNHRLVEARLTLMEYALTHPLNELLTKALDEIGGLVDSPIGFYHFLDADQKTLSLQQWSTQTLRDFCRAEGRGMHYGVDRAGVWADCVHTGKPVVHNDYASLPHKKGMPEGHAPVIRELVTPVMRAGQVVAILGVGNKPVDYTEKDIETVAYLSDVTWQLVEQKRIEEKQQASEQRYRDLYQSMRDAFVIVDMKGRIKECNGSFSMITGFTEEELKQKTYGELTPSRWHAFQKRIVNEQILPFGVSEVYEKEYQRKDGTVFPVELRTFLITDDDGRPTGMSAIVRDISERKWAEKERDKLQAQLNQAQKMESVGRLAGGVAHDFNNMLSVILGYAELALGKIDPDDPLHHDLQEIYGAGKRSVDITRQLLAFARKQTVAPTVLDLNTTVESMLKMLRRLIGEDINLAWLPGAKLKPIKMDPSQIDQIMANLCVNARDAIAGVGKVTIETGNVSFDEAYCADHAGFVAGDFVRMAVSDDGCGMDQETLGKLFEPFFTTKAMGEGTGLGLATVYGIVKQNNGFINVYSEPGQGTTFTIYLPVHEGETCAIGTATPEETLASPGETILVVEDEVAILNLSKTMLERLGYTVLIASSPGEAVRLAEEHGGEIHLLITDVVMPEMNGRELADRIHTRHPDIKALFMSGYTADVIAHRGILDQGGHFIHKPFSKQDLGLKVREALKAK
ncbi:PAS domain S-box protein [Desulfobulbus sp.]|uniref:PAS domain S-box protein n=1 Tax=Desulfobulbus sp. TaxID=895 RepID=UPI0027BA5343|nr:PAS domain S-box protein [Desulfobulbus sp.]